ncbi:hypothetical protein G7046_g4770 [Stylonectria norvegica]|nr:hypothetical protein G7046_g4770 [Stylonectria norvegica]
MSVHKDSFLDLERHRLQLEDNIRRLRNALQHWQTWDAEYEALKEEVDEVPETNKAELSRIQNQFEGELVNRKEVDEIFGKPGLRSKDQITNVLERRIDYVTKSIVTLQTQIEAAENKYAAATVISQPDATDEEGQPITEIIERLDDEDNVISYRLNKPGEALPQVREALEKAGVSTVGLSDVEPDPAKRGPRQPASRPQPPSQSNKEPSRPASVKKSVSFSDDTKTEASPTPTPKPHVSFAAKRVEHIMKDAKEQEKPTNDKPVIPEDEDPEDAELRRQMLQYSMGEVGAVVAELEIDGGDTDDDDYDFEYSDEGFEDDDDDDSHGRYKGAVVTDGYRQRMLELEKKLGIKSRFTSQSADEDADSGSDDERMGRIVIKQNPEPASSEAVKPTQPKSIIKEKQPAAINGKKGVRFASSLDVAPESEPAIPVANDQSVDDLSVKRTVPLVEPLSDVVERSAPIKSVDTKSSRKPSRFKKSVAEAGPNHTIPRGPLDVPREFLDLDRPTAPTGPEGTTLSETLVEREISAAPRPPDEFDDELIHGEVAEKYQRMRSKFIQREGGFLKEDENQIQPLDEEDGGPQRLSRFKAARLSKQ